MTNVIGKTMNAVMYNFAIGDKVVYNPNIVGLADVWQRPRDWGRVVHIDTHIHIKLYQDPPNTLKVLPYAVSHAPTSPKYVANRGSKLVAATEAAEVVEAES